MTTLGSASPEQSTGVSALSCRLEKSTPEKNTCCITSAGSENPKRSDSLLCSNAAMNFCAA